MNQTHVNHTATLLPDGRVLIADGLGLFDDEPVDLNTLEWFGPATDSWTTGSAGSPRFSATATLLPNGLILLYGGEQYNVEFGGINAASFCDVLDPVTGSRRYDSIHMDAGRAWHTATLLPDGTVLLAGGGATNPYASEYMIEWSETKKEVRFILATRQFQATASMNTRRHDHTATLLTDGTVLVAGGNFYVELRTPPYREHVNSLASTERYQPLPVGPDGTAGGNWTSAANLLESRAAHTATLLQDGSVLAAGGANYTTGEVLDSAERFFPDLPDLSGCTLPLATSMVLVGGLIARRWLRRQRGGEPAHDNRSG